MNTLDRIRDFFSSFGRPDPARDWLMTLSCTLALLIVLAFFAVHLFYSIQPPYALPDGGASAPIPVTRGDIENLLTEYQARQVRYVAHNLPAPPIVDPSK